MDAFGFLDLLFELLILTSDKRKSGALILILVLSVGILVPLSIIEFRRFFDAGLSLGLFILLLLAGLSAAVGVALLLFKIDIVTPYKPSEFVLIVLALTLLGASSSSYILRHQSTALAKQAQPKQTAR